MTQAVKSYQLKPHVYVVKQHRTVDDNMLDRMLERHIIPALDMFPDQPLIDVNTEILMSRPEIMSLSFMRVSHLEKSLDTLTELIGVDWLALQRDPREEIFFARVKCYQYIRYQAHLHIKHFIKFGEHFSVHYLDMPDGLLEEIRKADSLTELPDDIYDFIQKNKPQEEIISLVNDTQVEEEDSVSAELETVSVSKLTNSNDGVPAKTDNQFIDDIVITQNSLASISKKTDSLSQFQRLHPSIMSLHDYLRTNMKEIQEYHSDDCDIAFRGTWNDDTTVDVEVYSLNDSRGHNAWYINIIDTEI